MDGKCHNKSIGARGEEIAVAYLRGKSYTIVERNFRCKAGEIDIIAQEGKTILFVEVKARRNLAYGPPQLAVTPFKQRQISKAAVTWLIRQGKSEHPSRFDVVAILLGDHQVPEITHIKNAFDIAY